MAQSRFVTEILLPGGHGTEPLVDSRYSCFHIKPGESQIDRWGLFAAEPIPANRVVMQYTGEWINVEQAEYRALRQRNYLFEWSETEIIDGMVGGSGAQFANHSCAPNLRFRVFGRRVFLVSLRWIPEGEELTLDYHLSRDSTLAECHCGLPGCRGVINSARG